MSIASRWLVLLPWVLSAVSAPLRGAEPASAAAQLEQRLSLLEARWQQALAIDDPQRAAARRLALGWHLAGIASRLEPVPAPQRAVLEDRLAVLDRAIGAWTPEDRREGRQSAGADRAFARIPAPPPGDGTIGGRVVDRATSLPIAGVTVRALGEGSLLHQWAGTSDAFGRYRIDELPPNTYRLEIEPVEERYLLQVFEDMTCRGSCFDVVGTPVLVEQGTRLDGLDFHLDRGAVLSGRVTDRAGMPYPPVQIEVYDDAGWFVAWTTQDQEGHYRLGPLAAGTYFVVANSPLGLGRVFDDVPCPHVCDPTSGTPIVVGSGDIDGIDFRLDRLGEIEGRVTDSSGQPLDDVVFVEAYDETGERLVAATVDTDGTYRLHQVPDGTYRLLADSTGFAVDELWDDIPCPSETGGCDVLSGHPVAVALNDVVSGIDFALEQHRPGWIEGQVFEAVTGEPVAFATVEAREEGGASRRTLTRADGHYRFESMTPGRWRVAVRRAGYLNELYDGLHCDGYDLDDCWDLLAGTVVPVGDLGMVTGIDFALDPGGTIEGRVRDRVTGVPIEGAVVRVYEDASYQRLRWSGETDVMGRYRATGMRAGEFQVQARSDGYLPLSFEDVECRLDLGAPTCPLHGATPVLLSTEEVRGGVDFDLSPGGRIRGRVTVHGGGAPVTRLRVRARDGQGRLRAAVTTEVDGSYEIGPLWPTRYTVETAAVPFYGDVLWPAVECPLASGLCPLAEGTSLPVTGAEVHDDIDFVLAPQVGTCVPSSTRLCLDRGRFLVHARWWTSDGEEDLARAVPLPGVLDSGAFWFFDQDNIELVVKVLDGCALPFPSYWMFAGGLTDVGVELVVEDTVAGVERRYRKPPGEPFALIRDNRAFTTCDVAPPGPVAEPEAGLSPAVWRSGATVTTRADAGLCTPDDSTLCLHDRRFAVRIAWETALGDQGEGRAVPLSSDTGFFWFFDASNIELVVKALDGCNTAFESFWIFAGGLTDVGVTMTVTDTVSGEEKVYTNPLREPFQPILDTRAFATCMP